MEKQLEGEDKVRMLEREMRQPSGGGACPKCGNINHNRAPGQAGGRATAGWPRRGETRGSERVKGHREHGGDQGEGKETAEAVE
jgi:hypothetical protein